MTLDNWIEIAPLISCCAIVTSSIVALIVFLYTRRANRRRATLDMVMKTFIDDDARKRYDAFKELIRKDKDQDDHFKISSLVKLTAENGQDRSILLSQLNNYELVALGIRRGTFDEGFYKLWFHRQFTKDFDNVNAFVSTIQDESPSTFCEFQYLYSRWMKNRHPVTSPSAAKMAWWALTKNYKKLDAARRSMTS